jgi:hypothetical protein
MSQKAKFPLLSELRQVDSLMIQNESEERVGVICPPEMSKYFSLIRHR